MGYQKKIFNLREERNKLLKRKREQARLRNKQTPNNEGGGQVKKLVHPLNRKAGLIDAVLMALITGAFIGSVVTVFLTKIGAI